MTQYSNSTIRQSLKKVFQTTKPEIRKVVAARIGAKSIQSQELASRGEKWLRGGDDARSRAYRHDLGLDTERGKLVAKKIEQRISGGSGADKQEAIKRIMDGDKPSDLRGKFNAKEMAEIIKKVAWKQKMNIRRQAAVISGGGSSGGLASHYKQLRVDKKFVKKNYSDDSSRLGVAGAVYQNSALAKKVGTQDFRGSQASGSAQAQGGLASVGQKLNSGAIEVGGQHGPSASTKPVGLSPFVRR